MGSVAKIGKDQFDAEVLNVNEPVLVDFWAEWCGPCRALGPILEEVAAEVGNKARIVKINVDENPEIAQQYGIRGIPTMIFFKGGQVKKTLVGNQPKHEITKSINELL